MSATSYATMRRNTNRVIQMAADGWDNGDPWGSGMAALGAVCDVLYAAGASDLIDSGAGFRPGMGQTSDLDQLADCGEEDGEPWETVALAIELRAERIDLDDLALAGRALHLYLDVVRDAGRDY